MNISVRDSFILAGKILLAILIYIIAMIVSMACATLIYNFNNITSVTEMINTTFNSSIGNSLQAVLSIITLWLEYYILTKKKVITWNTLGLSDKLSSIFKKFIAGFIFATIFICIEILLLMLFTGSSLSVYTTGTEMTINIICGSITFASVAFSEEITFRGFIQGQFEDSRRLTGIIIASIIFAAIHLLNSKYSLISLIYLIIGGICFSVMRIVTKSLWFPIGFHLAWNWTESTIFGLNEENKKHWLYIKVDKTVDSLFCAIIMLIILVLLCLIYKKQKDRIKSNN